MLLDFEPRLRDTVPILLKMREGRLALEKAVDSGDAELIAMCAFHLRRTMKGAPAPPPAPGTSNANNPAETVDAGADTAFVRLVLGYPTAAAMLASYARATGSEEESLLLALLTGGARYVDAGMVGVRCDPCGW